MLWHRGHTLTAFPPFSCLPPSSIQTGHCVRAQMRFACMLGWITHAGSGNLDPCGLPPTSGSLKNWWALLSIYNFKQIAQLNWLRKTLNQRSNSLIWETKLCGASLQLPAGICLKKKKKSVARYCPHRVFASISGQIHNLGEIEVCRRGYSYVICMRSLILNVKMVCVRGWR